MLKKCAYESPEMIKLLGTTLRPGGFELTDRGIEVCQWRTDQVILDLGCGQGATMRYLNKKLGIRSVGIDPSEKLIQVARATGSSGDFHVGSGEMLPFDDDSFDGVISECTLSLMDELGTVLSGVHRVLKSRGYFFITDVYARKPELVAELKKDNFKSCMRGLYGLEDIKQQIVENGFEVVKSEDHSERLSQLMVKIIFEYGSMGIFWQKTGGTCAAHFQEALKKCKPGYYLLIARKID